MSDRFTKKEVIVLGHSLMMIFLNTHFNITELIRIRFFRVQPVQTLEF